MTAPTCTLQAPSGAVPGQFYALDGNAYTINADGTVVIPTSCMMAALGAGFTLTNDSIGSVAAIALTKLAQNALRDRVLSSVALAIGTTVTFSFGAFDFQIGALAGSVNTFKKKTASTGTAFGALGTVPASKWALILVQIAANGTVTFVSAAANYTTGYASEALAIAALPAATAANAVMGYITILASSSTWVAGTDALATGSGGNPAATTNYYNAGAAY